jgi:hypothetical protein
MAKYSTNVIEESARKVTFGRVTRSFDSTNVIEESAAKAVKVSDEGRKGKLKKEAKVGVRDVRHTVRMV